MYFYKPLSPNPYQVMPMEFASELHSHKPWCVGSVRKEGGTAAQRNRVAGKGETEK